MMYFLANAHSPILLDVVTSNLHRCIGDMMWRVLGNILCDPNWSQSHITYFIANTAPKPLDVLTSNFAGA